MNRHNKKIAKEEKIFPMSKTNKEYMRKSKRKAGE